MGVLCAASSSSMEEFAYNEELSQKAASQSAAGILNGFAVHPQMPASAGSWMREGGAERGVELLEKLAAQGRFDIIGETGFDLFNAAFRETEAVQDRLFAQHIECAIAHGLPVVIHARRAMHKIFACAKKLAKCKSVVFHSWAGTQAEGEALLKRGVNAYFSFGNAILLNHRQVMRCAALFAEDRLLTETDAPYQARRGQSFSHWADLPFIVKAAAALRREAGSPCADAGELEARIEANFRRAFT